jgi:molecular chaperone GrpE (heat shock protein)
MKRFFVVLLLLVATTALAADPQSTENSQSGAAGNQEPVEVRGVPEVSINKAEIEQYGSADKSTAPGLDDLPVNNPLMAQFMQIQEQASARLNELNAQLANQSSNEQALALVKEMENVKQEAELDMLRLQAGAAIARGDQATADEINAAIEMMTTPRPARPAVERPAPAGARR